MTDQCTILQGSLDQARGSADQLQSRAQELSCALIPVMRQRDALFARLREIHRFFLRTPGLQDGADRICPDLGPPSAVNAELLQWALAQLPPHHGVPPGPPPPGPADGGLG
jgi:hypothetical protein